jgi:hypothetical protein
MTEVTWVMVGVNGMLPLRATFQFAYFALAQLAPFPGWQRPKLNRPNADANQPPHWMTNRAAEVANLALFAFVQNKPQPGLAVPRFIPMLPPRDLAQMTNDLGRIDAQQIAFVPDSFLQPRQRFFGWLTFD